MERKRGRAKAAGRKISFCHQSLLTLRISEIVVMAKQKPLEEEMNLLVNHEAASSGRQTGVTGRRDDAGERLR